MEDLDLHKRLQSRTSQLKAEFDQWKPTFAELRDYIQPRRGRFHRDEKPTSGRLNKNVVDSTAREALKTFRSGMMAGMTPPSRRWCTLGTLARESDLSHAEKNWFHTATVRMHAIFNASNVYHMLPRAYEDVGLYGTHASIRLPDFENVVRFMSFPVGEYYIGQNDVEQVDSFHREYRRTVDQVVGKYGIDACSEWVKDAYRRGDLSHKLSLVTAIEPRRNRDPLGFTKRNMPVMCATWEADGHRGRFLEVGGFKSFPLIVTRWDVESPDVWGTSPGMDAFGDSAQLQQMQYDKALAIQLMHKPPLMGPSSLNKQRAKNFPGGITYVDSQDLNKGGYRPLYEVRPDINGLLEDIRDVRERINRAFFVDLFAMFTSLDRRQITAEEIIRRHEEKVLMLGPALERLNKELLDPIVTGVFEMMVDAELVPPAPESLQGSPIKIEYTSMLAQAQKAMGIQTMERAIGFVGTLGQIKPGALDLLDEDDMVREFWDISGNNPEGLRDREAVASIREQRAQQEQAQAMMENAEPMANAAALIADSANRGAQVI